MKHKAQVIIDIELNYDPFEYGDENVVRKQLKDTLKGMLSRAKNDRFRITGIHEVIS